jgi:hypothetical protein
MTMKPHFLLNVVLGFTLMSASVAACKSHGSAPKTPDKASADAAGGATGNTDTNATNSTTDNTNAADSTRTTTSDLAGKYNIVGSNPNGSTYRGTLEVIQHGQVYQFRWNAGEQYDGVGIQNGDVIAVAFASGTNGKGCGVVDYVITEDGTLDGKWGYWGVNESGTEKAIRTIGTGLVGAYDARGTNPGGKQYKVQIVVAPAGSGYQFAWSNNTEGFGIKQGDNVAVGIGGKRCGFVSYEIKPDGTLDGIWGGYGSQKTGTEKAVKQ